MSEKVKQQFLEYVEKEVAPNFPKGNLQKIADFWETTDFGKLKIATLNLQEALESVVNNCKKGLDYFADSLNNLFKK